MTSQLNSVLVVGGCGFLGHHIVLQLLDTHASQISVLDLRTTRNRFPQVDYYDGDITSRVEVASVLAKAKPQVIIHTASPTAIQVNKELFDRVNVRGTENLLRCAGESGTVRAFVFTSSASIVHDTVSDLVDADESWPVLRIPQQREYYSHSKGVAEGLVLAANRRHGDNMLTAAIRPAGLIGEGDVQFLPPVLEAYYSGRNNWQLGDNSNRFDVTYVGNAAHAHLLAAQALLRTHRLSIRPLDHERVDGEAFFVTNDEPLLFWDFVRKAWHAVGWRGSPGDAWVIPRGLGLVLATIIEWVVWIVTLGQREAQFKRKAVQYSCMTRTFRIDKAKKRLGYKPMVTIDDGIKKGAVWYAQQRKEALGEKKSK